MEEQELSLLSKKKNERHIDELDWESQTTHCLKLWYAV